MGGSVGGSGGMLRVFLRIAQIARPTRIMPTMSAPMPTRKLPSTGVMGVPSALGWPYQQIAPATMMKLMMLELPMILMGFPRFFGLLGRRLV